MKAKFIEVKSERDVHYLLIENAVIIADFYKENKMLLKSKGVLIIAIDGSIILSDEDREYLIKQFKEIDLNYKIISSFLWIEPYDVDPLFTKTDFGDTHDSCFFLNNKPKEFNFFKNKKKIKSFSYSILGFNITSGNAVPGLKHNMLSKELKFIFEEYSQYDLFYISDLGSELLIVAKNKEFINEIKNKIEIFE